MRLKVNSQSFPLNLPHLQFSNTIDGNSILLVTQAKNCAVIHDAYLSLTLHTLFIQKTTLASPSKYIQCPSISHVLHCFHPNGCHQNLSTEILQTSPYWSSSFSPCTYRIFSTELPQQFY